MAEAMKSPDIPNSPVSKPGSSQEVYVVKYKTKGNKDFTSRKTIAGSAVEAAAKTQDKLNLLFTEIIVRVSPEDFIK